MNWLTLIGQAPTIITILTSLPRIFSIIQTAIRQGFSLNTLQSLLDNQEIHDLFAAIGSIIFPNVKPELQATAAMASGVPEYVMKLQNGLNTVLGAGLDVDGHYGPKTRDAVLSFQKQFGLTQDEYAGDKTMAKLGEVLANKIIVPQIVVPQLPTTAIPAAA